MSKTLLFEIGTEEMPARYMPDALTDLARLAENKFKEARLEFGSIKTAGTPRRLVLIVEQLAPKQKDLVKEVRGPRYEQAFDAKGEPTKAAVGFAKAQGVKVEELVVKEVAGIKYVFATVREEGALSIEVLPNILANLVTGLSFPKSMRWGYSELRFARPIRWLLALYGAEVVPIHLENLLASRYTTGHRFLAPGAIEIKEAEEYQEVLKRAWVIVDPKERKEMIREQVKKAAKEMDCEVLLDEELLEEVNYLVEYPTAFVGHFAEKYLAVPGEVLTTTMKNHQRYFPLTRPDGSLAPYFVAVRNGIIDGIEVVREGNQRVLKARLEDALFFYREDTKEPLESKVPLLKNVLYQERLGTIFAKAQRLEKIALHLAGELGYGKDKQIARAALLCKADLETNMVYEFPELQGVMGRHYALMSGEEPEVAEAIYEHYLPRFAGDEIPVTQTGIVLSLAEKLDNLVGNFAIGVKPSGSQDPYALRRQAMGVVTIILARELSLDLKKALRKSYESLGDIPLDLDADQVEKEVLDFILQRFRGVMLEEGIPYDVLDAVLSEPNGDLFLLREKALALTRLKEEPYFVDVMTAFTRPYNLTRKEKGGQVEEKLFTEEMEKQVLRAVKKAAPQVAKHLESKNYPAYFKTLAGLRPVLDEFFDQVMVMVDDDRIRENRLALLNQVVRLFTEFAEFSRLVF